MAVEATIELDGQYRELREGAGWLRRERSVLSFRGPDAAELLQGQLTNDVEALEVGMGCYAALLDRKGHLQADMRVLRLADDELLLDIEPLCAGAVASHFQLYRLGSDAEIEEVDLTLVSVIGPAAAAVTGAPPLGEESSHAVIKLAGAEARAVATDLGVDLIVPLAGADAVDAALTAGGGVEVLKDAAEIVRVESGRPRFGREMGAGTMPAEAGINERAVSFTKGCYIGQETVARLHYRGKPNRHLRGLRLDGPVSAGDIVTLGDRELGQVGTAVISPALGPVALAILRREAEPGDTVAVGPSGAGAEVVELPFTDRG
jgi:folate-binding protein YgfZ